MRHWGRGEWGVVVGAVHLHRKKSLLVPKMMTLGAFCHSF